MELRSSFSQVVGILSGGVVGLFGRQLVLPPETAPLGWLYIGISKLGAAAVPINLILLGAALSRGQRVMNHRVHLNIFTIDRNEHLSGRRGGAE